MNQPRARAGIPPAPSAEDAALNAPIDSGDVSTPAPRRTARSDFYSDEMHDNRVHDDDDLNVLDLTSSNVAQLMQNQGIQIITEREFGSDAEARLEYEKFMEMPIVIEIGESTDKTASPVVFVGVNGDGRWLPRGVPIKLQRKFVERLAQSQERHYTTTPNRDAEADNALTVRQRSVEAFTFHVLRDSHPRGRQWLNRVKRSG